MLRTSQRPLPLDPCVPVAKSVARHRRYLTAHHPQCSIPLPSELLVGFDIRRSNYADLVSALEHEFHAAEVSEGGPSPLDV